MLRDVALRVLSATSKSANVFGAMCRIRVWLDGFFNAANTNHNGWLTGRTGPQRGLDGGSGYPPRCPLSYCPHWDAGGVPGWRCGRVGCPAGVYTHP